MVDGLETFNVLNMVEITGRRGEFRRRWLEIEGGTYDMRFPWSNKLEQRADTDFSDAYISAILSRAQGNILAYPAATAALESCAGLVGRGFMAAEVIGPDAFVQALSPSCLEMVGRSLIRNGESVFLIDTQGGRLRLLPGQSYDVEGGPDPDSWEYRITVGGPSRTFTHNYIPGSSVLHFKYAVDAARPWRGNGPIEIAALAGRSVVLKL